MHILEQRWKINLFCPQCGIKTLGISRNLFDCKSGRTQTSLTAGTIFHGTRVPLVKWYWLIYRMAMDKVGVSVAEMQRILLVQRPKIKI